MICKQCHQAFNGSAGICHICGTVHGDPVITPKGEVVEKAESDKPIAVPEKKKKAHK